MRFSWNIIWFEKIGTLRLMYFGNVINFVFRKSGVVWQRDSVGCDIWDKLCDVRLFWILQHSPVTSLKKTKNIAPNAFQVANQERNKLLWYMPSFSTRSQHSICHFFFFQSSVMQVLWRGATCGMWIDQFVFGLAALCTQIYLHLLPNQLSKQRM